MALGTYLGSIAQGDCATAFGLLTSRFQARFGSAAQLCVGFRHSLTGVGITGAVISDIHLGAVHDVTRTTAKVAVAYTWGATRIGDTATMVRVRGRWLLAGLG
jgi:hypothetical protein